MWTARTQLTREKRQAFRNRAIISENTTSRTLQSLFDESTEQLATHPLQDCRRCSRFGPPFDTINSRTDTSFFSRCMTGLKRSASMFLSIISILLDALGELS